MANCSNDVITYSASQQDAHTKLSSIVKSTTVQIENDKTPITLATKSYYIIQKHMYLQRSISHATQSCACALRSIYTFNNRSINGTFSFRGADSVVGEDVKQRSWLK